MSLSTQLAVLADGANISREGKLNILGEFNLIWAAEEPIIWPLMMYVAKINGTEADGLNLEIALRVINDDEELVAGPIGIKLQVGKSLVEGVGNAAPIFVPIMNARFPTFGTYHFVLSDKTGKEFSRAPIYVIEASKMPQGHL